MNDFDRHRRPEVSNSVLETWKISTKRIREESELSYRILHVIAYLDSQHIPHELIVAASQYIDGEEDKTEQVTELKVQRAVMRLVEFSFLDLCRGEGGLRSYEMHKLVQEAIRYGLWVQRPTVISLGSSTIGQNRLENGEVYYSSIALHIVDDVFPVPERDFWAQCEQYLTYVIRVGEWAELSGQEVETSALLTRVSDCLYRRGRWREKKLVNQRVLHLRQEVLGRNYPDTITSMRKLASTYLDQGQYDKAERLEEKALSLQFEALVVKHPEILISTTSPMTTHHNHHNQGRYDEAEWGEKIKLYLQQEGLGLLNGHTGLFMSLGNLATIYRAQRRYNEAESYKATLRFQQNTLEEKNPAVATSMAGLAKIFSAQGRYNEAERLIKEALHLQWEAFGEKHLYTTYSMEGLASIYHRQGRYNEAEEIAVKALNFRREAFGEKHPQLITGISNLALIYYKQGRYNKAEKLAKEALDCWREALGEKHAGTMAIMIIFAAVCYHQDRYNEAEEIAAKALDLRREVLGEKHLETIKSVRLLAAIYYQ